MTQRRTRAPGTLATNDVRLGKTSTGNARLSDVMKVTAHKGDSAAQEEEVLFSQERRQRGVDKEVSQLGKRQGHGKRVRIHQLLPAGLMQNN